MAGRGPAKVLNFKVLNFAEMKRPSEMTIRMAGTQCLEKLRLLESFGVPSGFEPLLTA